MNEEVDVDVGVLVLVEVAVGLEVLEAVADGVEVEVEVRVAVFVEVMLGVAVRVVVGVDVEVGVVVNVEVDVIVAVEVRVEVKVDVNVQVGVGLEVKVGVEVRVEVGVAVRVAVAVDVREGVLVAAVDWLNTYHSKLNRVPLPPVNTRYTSCKPLAPVTGHETLCQVEAPPVLGTKQVPTMVPVALSRRTWIAPPVTVPATLAVKDTAPLPKSRLRTWIQSPFSMFVTAIPPSEQVVVCIPDSLAIMTARWVEKGSWFFSLATPAVVGVTTAIVPSELKYNLSRFTLR